VVFGSRASAAPLQADRRPILLMVPIDTAMSSLRDEPVQFTKRGWPLCEEAR
jgi:hypothetical protein